MSEQTELMEVVKQTAFNVSAISQQMGLITTEIKHIKAKQIETDGKLEEITDEIQGIKDRERVSRPEARNIRNSVHARVNALLNIRYENGVVAQECLYDDKYYRSGFISRCYVDARKYSKMGNSYMETCKRDLAETLDYVNTWLPPQGVAGYKAYLDARRNA